MKSYRLHACIFFLCTICGCNSHMSKIAKEVNEYNALMTSICQDQKKEVDLSGKVDDLEKQKSYFETDYNQHTTEYQSRRTWATDFEYTSLFDRKREIESDMDFCKQNIHGFSIYSPMQDYMIAEVEESQAKLAQDAADLQTINQQINSYAQQHEAAIPATPTMDTRYATSKDNYDKSNLELSNLHTEIEAHLAETERISQDLQSLEDFRENYRKNIEAGNTYFRPR
jgi:chromosome segregation ATPase